MADREAIAELLARFAWTYDEGRFEEHATCFIEDALFVIEVPGADPLRVEGRQAIVELQSGAYRQQGDQRRHVVTNLLFESEEASSAEVASYLTLGVAAGGRFDVALTGTFRDRVVLDGDAWKFAERRLRLDVAPR